MGNKKPVFGTRLKCVRKRYYKTQQAFADAFGVSLDTVQNWEQGKNPPKMEGFIELCNFFGCDADYFLGEIDERTHDLQYIHDVTGLSEKSIEALRFINRRNLGEEALTIAFINRALEHLYSSIPTPMERILETESDPEQERLAPLDTVFSVMEQYVSAVIDDAAFRYITPEGCQVTEYSNLYGIDANELYRQSKLYIIQSCLEALRREAEHAQEE